MDSELLFPEEQITGLKINRVIKRDGRIVSFNKNKIADSIFCAAVEVGGSNRELAQQLTNKVVAIINDIYPADAVPGVEEIQDLIEKVLVENGHYRTAKAYILYRAEHARIRENKDSRIVVEDNVPYKILWRAFTWNAAHGCDTVEKLNGAVRSGTFKDIVDESEKLYHAQVDEVAAKIYKNRNEVRLVIVAGPSSSGKTTTTTKIAERLKERGLSFVLINCDNYFKNLTEHPIDEYGDYDFESPQALNLELVNEDLSKLLQGNTIYMPRYDFKTGIRSKGSEPLKLLPGQIALIDSLHGLYPAMTVSIPHEMKFKFYIEALCQIRDARGEFMRWSDLRMLRRMVRDSLHRSYDPERTVGHWHYVRRSEKKYIVPYINKADYVFNGSFAYELPVYKKYLFKSLPAIVEKFANDPKRIDAFIRAKRVYTLLLETAELFDDSIIPSNSVIREFIGGSSYKY